jgi:hypothetical protein
MMVMRWKASERQMSGYGLECGHRRELLFGLNKESHTDPSPTKLEYATEGPPLQRLSYDAAFIQSFKSVVA